MIEFNKETVDQRREVLREQLINGIAEVTFTKVDGTVRTMPCTLDASIIPPAPLHVTNTDNPVDFPKTKKSNPLVMSVWCTDKGEWRSFRLENVISVKAV
jgi:oxalate decarboxylase/phosphoglucose isomerase-like protein (cupin superfamily)